jgi:hypothetical protein
MTTANFCFYLQNRPIQTSQTGGQWYSDTSPLVFPGMSILLSVCLSNFESIIFYYFSGGGVDWVVSPLSRVLTIFYIVIGAPIMYFYISTTGGLFARALR